MCRASRHGEEERRKISWIQNLGMLALGVAV
jgi:hypothetical protein